MVKEETRRSMVVGVGLYDNDAVPRFCYGCFYSKLTVEGVVTMEAILDQPNVKAAYDNFMDAFGEAAQEVGLEAALMAGANPETVKKVKEHKEKKRKEHGGKGGRGGRGGR